MKEYLSRIGTKGQITLPLEARKRLGLKPKDRVAIVVEQECVVVKAAHTDLASGFQSIPALEKRMSVEEMTEIAAEENALATRRQGA